MSDPIELIHQFNHDAGLVQRGYDDFLESSFQIEEALEGFDVDSLAAFLGTATTKPKDIARELLLICNGKAQTIPNVDRLDKACDSVVFAIGSMTKLGLNVDQIKRALNAVMKANFQKLSMPKDEFGKLMKPENFVGPEVALQAILDEVSNVSLP